MAGDSRTPGWMYDVRDESHHDQLAEADAEAAGAMQRILGEAFHFFLTNIAAINRAIWAHLSKSGRTLKQPPARQQSSANPTDRLVILDHTNCFLFYCASVAVPKNKQFALGDLSQGKNPLAVLTCVSALEKQLTLITPFGAVQSQSVPVASVPLLASISKIASAEKKTPVSSGYGDAEDSPPSSPRNGALPNLALTAAISASEYIRPVLSVVTNGSPAVPPQIALKPIMVATYGDQVSPSSSPERSRPAQPIADPPAAVTRKSTAVVSGYGTPPESPPRLVASVAVPKPAAPMAAPAAKQNVAAAAAGYGDAYSPPSSPDKPIMHCTRSAALAIKPAPAPQVQQPVDEALVPVAKPKATTPAGYGDAASPLSSPDRPIIRASGPKSGASAVAPTVALQVPEQVASGRRDAAPAKQKAAVAGYGDADSPPSSPDRPIIRNSGTASIAAKPKAVSKPPAVANYDGTNSPPSSPDRPILRNSKSSSSASAAGDCSPKFKKAAAVAYSGNASPPSSPDRPIVRSASSNSERERKQQYSKPAPSNPFTTSLPSKHQRPPASSGYGDAESPPSSPDRPIHSSSGSASGKAAAVATNKARGRKAAASGYGDYAASPPSSPDRPIMRNSDPKAAVAPSGKAKQQVVNGSSGYGDARSPSSSPDRPIMRHPSPKPLSNSGSGGTLRSVSKEALMQSAANYGAAASPPPSEPKLTQKLAQFADRSPKILDSGYRDVDDSGAPMPSPTAFAAKRGAAVPVKVSYTGKADLAFPDPQLFLDLRAAFNRPRVRIALAPAPLALSQGHYGHRLFLEMRPRWKADVPTFESFLTALYEHFSFTAIKSKMPVPEMKELEACLRGFLCNGAGQVTAEEFGNFVSFFGPCYRDGRDFIDNVFDLLSKRWLHPTTDNEVVNRLLNNERPGTFLVRMSRERGAFVVCVKYLNDVKQFKVFRGIDGFRLADGVSAPSIQDLVVLLRAQPLVYPLARTRYVVNSPVASGLDLVKPETLAMKAARAVAESWWRYPGASRLLSGPAQTLLGKAVATHYLQRAQFLLAHFAFGSGEQLTYMLRFPRVVRWWTDEGPKCSQDSNVHIPSWAALLATEFGIPYADLCAYLASVVNDFAGTQGGSPLVYTHNLAHIARFHLTFSNPDTAWPDWYLELRTLVSKPWFYGTLSAADAAQLIERQAQGTFLIRFSAPPGALAICSMSPGNVVKHYKVGHEAGKKYTIADTSDFNTLDELLAGAERMCFCKTPVNAPRKFRLWLSSAVPDPPARLVPPKELKDDYRPVAGLQNSRPPVSSGYGAYRATFSQSIIPSLETPDSSHVILHSDGDGEERPMMRSRGRDYSAGSVGFDPGYIPNDFTPAPPPLTIASAGYGNPDVEISQSPPARKPAAAPSNSANVKNQVSMYGDEGSVGGKGKREKKAKKVMSGYGGDDGDSGNDSSPWEEDPNAAPLEVQKEDAGGDSSPWDDEPSGTARARSPRGQAQQKSASSEYLRPAVVPPSDYLRGANVNPRVPPIYPTPDYPLAPPPSDYARPRNNAQPAVSSGYGHAAPLSEYVRPAIAVVGADGGRAPSAFSAAPTIQYPHSDEDRSSPAPQRATQPKGAPHLRP